MSSLSDIVGKTGKKPRFFVTGRQGFTIYIANIVIVRAAQYYRISQQHVEGELVRWDEKRDNNI